MADPALIANLASILHSMQQAVQSSGASDPAKALGPLTKPWLAVRAALGPPVQGRWATLEETQAALVAALAAPAPAGHMQGMSDALDFDPSWDIASTACTVCGSLGKGPTGQCLSCGS